MTIEDFSMSRCLVVVAVLAGVACTKPNPRSCADGTCTDPAYPFCDVDGALEGHPDTCIAVSCTPGDVAACRGDVALTCNAEGTTYDEVQCTRGCDVTIAGGCRVCEPNQTVCANGAVQSCDANGNVTSSESCPLGCFEDQPRCREIDPSNNLGMYLDMVQSPPDLDLTNAVFDTKTGMVTDGGAPVSVPSFMAPAATGGIPIRVFVANNVTIDVAATPADMTSMATGPALAVLARGTVTLKGQLRVTALGGGTSDASCDAGRGSVRDDGTFGFASGGGGGGNASDGAPGGGIPGYQSPGTKGSAGGTASLTPLRGGCTGGGMLGQIDPNPLFVEAQHGGDGGGAVQISSRKKIEIDGTIDVRGVNGLTSDFGQGGQYLYNLGGGAGGAILLEAPHITLGPNAKLLGAGGNGGQACTTPGTFCGAGGHGATAGTSATAGADSTLTGATAGMPVTAGGGGGGLGRVRINTVDQTYSKSNSTVEDAALTVGTLATR